ncbi:hypothetical protein CTI12_AA588450 [Artemisia annua]|uniref:Uncharacterized protein n=1 Tax=Artemisia annua TaxID=35608 RepID=A0A2U1KLV7_ARTAN|nr:hypothetical protein CTI12_AA588450 [Artemisia annua]
MEAENGCRQIFSVSKKVVVEHGYRKTLNSEMTMLVFASTSYDIHRSIKLNETPPSKEQIQAMEDYLASKRRRD